MNEVTFAILKAVFSVVAVVITYYVIPVLKNFAEDQKNKEVVKKVEQAVRAAEQLFKGKKMGETKKEEVLEWVRAWLIEKGIDITDQQLNELLEASVWSMNNE